MEPGADTLAASKNLGDIVQRSDVALQIRGTEDWKLKRTLWRPTLVCSAVFMWLYYFLILSENCASVQVINEIPILTKYMVHRNISIEGDDFILDGKKIHILSGSFHYFRSPAAYWRDRLRKLKMAGLNAVSTYVEWSFHETEERVYNFEGDRDIVSFINIAAQEGLLVLLRPGPYICAERDLGGFPYWLLGKYPKKFLRTLDPDFINETRIWINKLFERLTPLLYGYGGPIIMVQVENEYGSSHSIKKSYKVAIRNILSRHVGGQALLYTSDGPKPCRFIPGSVNGTLTTINFGGDNYDVDKAFTALRRFMPEGPLMNSEFYPGWVTHWTEPFQRTLTTDIVPILKAMLDRSIHVNFYMFCGGTNFEYTSGANYFSRYEPAITSYDYDAPLTEAGDPTEKYFKIKAVLEEYFPSELKQELPQVSPKGAYGKVVLSQQVELLSAKGRKAFGVEHPPSDGALPTFEKLRQRSGLLLFETEVNMKADNETQWLTITKPRDHVSVYLNGELQGLLSRINHVCISMRLKIKRNSTVLALLVENLGRVNYGIKLHDSKGILSPVLLDGSPPVGPWLVTGFPLQNMDVSVSDSRRRGGLLGPVLYQGFITLPQGEQPLETFLDTSGWRKGYVWVNGYNLGRYWKVGPQRTLYVPGVWLKPAPAQNHIQVLELEDEPSNLTMKFIDYPILDQLDSEEINWHWPEPARQLGRHYNFSRVMQENVVQ